jgi:hypothetical protein
MEMTKHVKLVDAEERSRRYPDTFDQPPVIARHNIPVGGLAKLVFTDGSAAERMWVRVTGVHPGESPAYLGMLVNEPVTINGLDYGDNVGFDPRHVIDIDGGERR